MSTARLSFPRSFSLVVSLVAIAAEALEIRQPLMEDAVVSPVMRFEPVAPRTEGAAGSGQGNATSAQVLPMTGGAVEVVELVPEPIPEAEGDRALDPARGPVAEEEQRRHDVFA